MINHFSKLGSQVYTGDTFSGPCT